MAKHYSEQSYPRMVCGLFVACCLHAEDAHAKASTANNLVYYSQDPIVEFTHSLAQLNRVAETCKDVESADYRTYSKLIQQYIQVLYDGDAPYWVLAQVKDHITDQTICKWMVSESLLHYQFAYRDYVEVAHPQVMPPLLTESMSQPGHGPIETATLGIARPFKN